jgi:glycosyltransferase involved in cell wall biosynthesis
MSNAQDSFSAALVIDEPTFARLGPVIGHLAVGLLDFLSHVTLITPAKAALGLSLGPVRVIRHPPLIWPLWEGRFANILRELRTALPGVIHVFSRDSLPLGEALAARIGRPLVAHLLDSHDVQAYLRSSRCRHLIAASTPLQAAAAQRRPGMHVSLVRPGLLTAGGPTCFSRPGLLPTLLCMSAFEAHTGVDQLVRAAAQLSAEGREFMLLLLARGPTERPIRKLVEAGRLIKHVTFGEPIADWELLMKTADVFVVPAATDCVDVPALHALAAGLAVVTCRMDSSDFIIHERTALVCEQPTSQQLAVTLRRLLDDPALARRLASAAIDHCLSHHSLSTMTSRTVDVYRQAVEEQSG